MKILTKIGIRIITCYQVFISPMLPRSCRFYPSCSEYAKEALKRYGIVHGGFLAIKRILRCNPFFPGGYDPLN
ncbi:MAG: membrane protein insertion efficiency factor YidD [candidate division WOR-3 bacterium]|nr:membrane protein insertion efficiency factor YidD [candidate division WOR-3 bacterium]MCX7756981.1 membrane protein insertion efficiency factor YidD [candidate division WOR-3 bacterium]MDW7987840.1 membrane protein insertion efficiency factor YidD [candidate division WOR-3 bacterium]